MKITAIKLRHITHFSQLNITFQEQPSPITLIIGDQASGKTSIIKHIFQALSWFAARLRDSRSSGIVIPDLDIMSGHLQAKVAIQVRLPDEILALEDDRNALDAEEANLCSWQVYKTLNAEGIGISQVETEQLDHLLGLYQQAQKKDPLMGLPLIAYYPTERFVNEVNLLSKNIASTFQPSSAYDLAALPFTTFSRFFEWFREVSDAENAQTAALFREVISREMSLTEYESQLHQHLQQQYAQLHAPCLKALQDSIHSIFPEIDDLYLDYHPKLELIVKFQGKEMAFSQLSNSYKNWMILIADIVRRLCLLNPNSLFPCLEGEGILLIDDIDSQLDPEHNSNILQRLHQTFPRLQIIASARQEDILDNAPHFQCFRLAQHRLSPIQLTPMYLTEIYDHLMMTPPPEPEQVPCEQRPEVGDLSDILNAIQQLNNADFLELMQLLPSRDTESAANVLQPKNS